MNYEHDLNKTQSNRAKLLQNKNLLYWYEILFKYQFKDIIDLGKKGILEIGSGTSPIKLFYPQIMTSDVLNLDYLDYIFDCHEIDKFNLIPDASIDIITMTNVLHHLRKPMDFFLKASNKLKPEGMIIITEPFFSCLSYLIYNYVHHEPVDLKIKKPELDQTNGPLSSANPALPHLIFFSDRSWKTKLRQKYDIDNCTIDYFGSISYFITGGISYRFPIPHRVYKLISKFDLYLSRLFPDFFASFFILRMKKVKV